VGQRESAALPGRRDAARPAGGTPALLVIAALLALIASCKPAETPVAAAPPGDIILVTIDTWRADAAGFAGNSNVKTPFLDSLAARGIVFSNAHAHNVITLPSHVNILTGLNPYQHGVHENAGFTLGADTVTLAERLKGQGYATGAFVAAYPLDAKFGLNQGFDVYDDNYGKGRASLDFTIQERPATAVLTAATQWWNANANQKRFLWVHLYDPHAPYVPSYLGEVAKVDEALQQQLAPLLRDDTTVIVTGDHGEALGDHGELTHGLFAYESTLKIPLIVVAPGVKARVEPLPVAHVDIAPTVLARAGMTPPKELPGQSLLGTIQPRDTYFESLSASLNRGWAPLTGIIRNGTKYIDLPIAELYDLPKDPAEKLNLVKERRREALAARNALYAVRVLPSSERKVAPEEVARLRSLGYVAGTAGAKTAFTEADDPKNLVDIDAKMHRVIDLYQRGFGKDAVVVAREIVKEQPHMDAGSELLAFVLQQDEQIREAIRVLSGLVADGDGSESVKVQLALLLTDTGHAADAAKLLETDAQKTTNPDLLNAYGVALDGSGKSQDAIGQFLRALEIDPNNAPAVQNLGISALRLNDGTSAQRYLTRALEMNPRLPLALNTMGVIYARNSDFNRAIDSWNRAVDLDPRQYDALFNIGLVAFRTGNRAEAKRALERFVRTAPPTRYGREIADARKALTVL
jgi:arylsulfatase A-like enzyme/Flp pilus assembly protein TadD